MSSKDTLSQESLSLGASQNVAEHVRLWLQEPALQPHPHN